LNNAIKKYPNYNEAFLARAQLLFCLSDFENAIKDYRFVISQDNNSGVGKTKIARIGLGDCFKSQKKYLQAMESYEEARKCENISLKELHERRAYTNYYLENQEDALNDIQIVSQNCESLTISLLYLKGKILYKLSLKKPELFSESILTFEQVIMDEPQSLSSAKSLYRIAVGRISQKDFYEAFYTVQRYSQLNTPEYTKLLDLKKFIEGVNLIRLSP